MALLNDLNPNFTGQVTSSIAKGLGGSLLSSITDKLGNLFSLDSLKNFLTPSRNSYTIETYDYSNPNAVKNSEGIVISPTKTAQLKATGNDAAAEYLGKDAAAVLNALQSSFGLGQNITRPSTEQRQNDTQPVRWSSPILNSNNTSFLGRS
jgi:hypothetical protein